MDPLSFLLPRPAFDKTPEMLAAFEQLSQSTPAGGFVDYDLSYPKWQYLSYLCDTKELVLHTSQNLDIDEVEPRRAIDKKAFSNQRAIYATTDGIFVIYFAIIDRKQYPEISLFNSCLQARISPDLLTDPFYFFSITHSVLLQKPWCQGRHLHFAAPGLRAGTCPTGTRDRNPFPALDQHPAGPAGRENAGLPAGFSFSIPGSRAQ